MQRGQRAYLFPSRFAGGLRPDVFRVRCDRTGLGRNAFTAEALALIVRTGEGLLRRSRNLCLSSLIEAVRDQTRSMNLKQVHRVLIQSHRRKDCDNPIA